MDPSFKNLQEAKTVGLVITNLSTVQDVEPWRVSRDKDVLCASS